MNKATFTICSEFKLAEKAGISSFFRTFVAAFIIQLISNPIKIDSADI